MINEEIWIMIPRCEYGYKASNLGRIKSFKKNKIDGEILEFKPNKYGDLYGIFYDNKNPK